MSKPWILVSPSSRGLGYALTRHLLRTTRLPILATCRSSPSSIKSTLLEDAPAGSSSRLTVLQLDVTDESTLQSASEQAAALFPHKTHHLHLGFALPGVLYPEKSPSKVDYADALRTLQVNVLGPMMLMKHFGEFLPRKSASLSLPPPSSSSEGSPTKLPSQAVWTTLSARVGSITDNKLGGWYSYRASKAGVNALTKSFDLHLRHRSGEKAVAVAYHPGTVKTELSREFWANVKPEKLFSPEYAAEKLVEVACSRDAEDRGRIWDWKGEEITP